MSEGDTGGHRRKKTWVYLFSSYGTVLLLAMFACTAVSVFALRNTAYRETEGNLRQFSYAIAHNLDANPELLEPVKLQKFCQTFGAEPEFRITYIKADGTVLADSDANPENLEDHSYRPEFVAALAGKEATATRFSESLGRRMTYYAIPYRHDVLRVAIADIYVDDASRKTAVILVTAAFVILLITLAVSIFISTRIGIPLAQLGKAARDYAEGKMDREFAKGRYPEEFIDLANTFSAMAEKIAEKIRALDAQNKETGAILASMNDALIVLDETNCVLRVNRAAEDLFGISAYDAPGMPLIQAVRNTGIVDFVTNPGDDETERTIEIRSAGTEPLRYILIKNTKIEGSPEKLLVFSDITRLKNLERIRKDFVANVSHELKTPITSIQGFIETLKDGAIDDRDAAHRFIAIMEQQALRLGAIIDDLLTLSRLEQNETATMPMEKTAVSDLFAEVKTLCADKAEKRRTTLVFSCQENLECVINPGLMEQAITNLVQNAIKYSPEGAEVTIQAWVEQKDSGEKDLVFKVTDNGPGIAETYLSRIFERFYRVDPGRSREQGGTGLGLAIVRHIAIVHGGTVSVKSAVGSGSSFRITLPFREF
jgi:two-component system phosphate regulon sensor histidine kinase PhoR